MKNFIRIIPLAVACVLLSAGAVQAQMGGMMRPPSMQGVWSPVVGTGAVYELTDKKQQKNSLEITIVGKETVNGKDAYWMEFGMQEAKSGSTMYMKMLMAKDQNNVATQRMIMQVPGQPQPIEMSMSMAVNANSNSQSSDIRDKAERVGTESITVPGGTFECEHYRMKDGSGDVWISAKVAPWGMVKFVGKDSSMVLTKQISDAKDHITGTPVKFDPAEMMRQPRP